MNKFVINVYLKIKPLPVIGPVAFIAAKGFKRLTGAQGRKYAFKRLSPPTSVMSADDCSVWQIKNLLNYTKTSGSTYDGQDFPAGYHTLELRNLHLEGQRHPKERFKLVPYDFTGKTVLDIGSNQGGMLFSIADKISCGVGVDYDYRLVNAANRIRSYTGTNHLNFYVFNLERESLDLIADMIPGGKVDIVFLLAVCMWIKNWKQVIDKAHDLSESMLFESNGTKEQQDEQFAYLKTRYETVQLLSDNSSDDISQHARRLYLCH